MQNKRNFILIDFSFAGYVSHVSPLKTSKNGQRYVNLKCVNFHKFDEVVMIVFEDRVCLNELKKYQFIKADGNIRINKNNNHVYLVPDKIQILAMPELSKKKEQEIKIVEDLENEDIEELEEPKIKIEIDENVDLNDISKIYGENE